MVSNPTVEAGVSPRFWGGGGGGGAFFDALLEKERVVDGVL